MTRAADTLVEVWSRTVGDADDAFTHGEWLDDIERDRWERIADPAAARAYVAAHALARSAVSHWLGTDPASLRFDRRCTHCLLAHGRPGVVGEAGLHVSLSRSRRLVAVALTRVGPVGVDVELRSDVAFPGFDDVARHPDERRLDRARTLDAATLWVRKEAALKALGVGLRADPATVVAPVPGGAAMIRAGWPPVTVSDVVLDDVHATAVAVVGADGPWDVRVR